MLETKEKYAVPALDKAFQILEFLAQDPLPRTQAEIAKSIGKGANEIYRVLINLEKNGYLIRDSMSGRYRLSLKLYNLSRSISPVDQVRQVAIPIMDDLVATIGLSCHLTMLHQSKTMVIIHSRSSAPISLNVTEGTLFSTLNSNAGMVLLANSNAEVREMILQREEDYQAYAETKKAALFSRLEDVLQSGFVSGRSLIDGVYEYSCLIGQPRGKIIAALTATSLGPLSSLSVGSGKIASQMKAAAQEITESLSLLKN